MATDCGCGWERRISAFFLYRSIRDHSATDCLVPRQVSEFSSLRPPTLARPISNGVSLPNNGPPVRCPATRRRAMWSVGPHAASRAPLCSAQTRILPFARSCCATQADTSAAATIKGKPPARLGETSRVETGGLFGRLRAHNPLHELSDRIFDLRQLKIRGQHLFWRRRAAAVKNHRRDLAALDADPQMGVVARAFRHAKICFGRAENIGKGDHGNVILRDDEAHAGSP